MDIWGVPGVEAEAELLAAVTTFFKRVGLTSADVGIKVNSRGVLAEVLASLGVPPEKFAATCVLVDKLEKVRGVVVNWCGDGESTVGDSSACTNQHKGVGGVDPGGPGGAGAGGVGGAPPPRGDQEQGHRRAGGRDREGKPGACVRACLPACLEQERCWPA